jgi:dTDP-4-amino-4,6-dideoxygalactose transaminase
MDPGSLEAAIDGIEKEGKLRPKVVIAVDLFGQSADYPKISAVTRKHGLKLIADSAQGFGCTIEGRHPLFWADVATTSFFPAKPLGCYGDGGAVLTNDSLTVELVDSLRVHGKATKTDIASAKFDHDPKYMNMRIGRNSRLDTIQAAILIQKLTLFAEELDLRNRVADRYAVGLGGAVASIPSVIKGGISVWAQYTIEHVHRDKLAVHLKSKGIPTAIYYPLPLHLQSAYAEYPRGAGGLGQSPKPRPGQSSACRCIPISRLTCRITSSMQ